MSFHVPVTSRDYVILDGIKFEFSSLWEDEYEDSSWVGRGLIEVDILGNVIAETVRPALRKMSLSGACSYKTFLEVRDLLAFEPNLEHEIQLDSGKRYRVLFDLSRNPVIWRPLRHYSSQMREEEPGRIFLKFYVLGE